MRALLPSVAAQIMAIYALMCVKLCARVPPCVYARVVTATKDAFGPEGRVESFGRLFSATLSVFMSDKTHTTVVIESWEWLHG